MPSPATINWSIRRGEDWRKGPFYFYVNGEIVDISSNTYQMLVKRKRLDVAEAFEITCTVVNNGLYLSLSAAAGLAVEVGETPQHTMSQFVHDLRQTNGSGLHDYPWEGCITLHAMCSDD